MFKFLFFLALAIACVVAVEEVERVKKQVLVGGYPYGLGYTGLGYTGLGYTGLGYTGGVLPYHGLYGGVVY